MKYLRAVLGVIGGYALLAAIVIVGVMILSPAFGVEAPGDVSAGYLAANLVLSFLAAVAGGYAAAWIGGPLRLVSVAVLAALVLVAGFLMEGSSGQPGWYPLLIPLIGAVGVAIGGWLRHEPATNPAIL